MKLISHALFSVSLMVFSQAFFAQNNYKPTTASCYWQQHVDYTMDITMNVENYQYSGTQKLIYANNSPDVLNRVFYHLYPNAFQPGSEMDARVQSISDPDGRMAPNVGTKEAPNYDSRIAKLKPNEIGYIKVNSLSQDGAKLSYEVVGTILVVTLNQPIQPGGKTTFDMQFDAQVPLQIRRSGRNNNEGIALSMTQWYPKLAEYDDEGWHADPYIAREFYGVWGDFDVKITIDKNYTIAGTGYLQNPNEIGHGYETEAIKKQKGKTLTWHFNAPNVHDFAWAADPDYIHDKLQVKDGPMMHFFYKNNPKMTENWKNMEPIAEQLMAYYSEHVGQYPYKQYSVIQGGDGGMEYGMCTLILGEGTLEGLISVTAHEMAHSWFQFVIANNESKHPWMDEGFTSYIEDRATNHITEANKANPYLNAYRGYVYLAKSGKEQPQTTHGDRYTYNQAYSISSYTKGELFLSQLGYIIGEDNLNKTLKQYFAEWSFKHPKPMDVIRVAEKVSGLELDWYLTDWTETTNTIDYGVKSVESDGSGTKVTLERIGVMPMPIDVRVEYTDGTKEQFNIPLRMMYGAKPTDAKILKDWAWAYPTYEFTIDKARPSIKSVTIDPNEFMADINRENNTK